MGKVTRRDFIVKGGKYALVTGTAMQVLFTSKRAMAQSGLARFMVGVEGDHSSTIFFGPPSTSPSGTWRGTGAGVAYQRYSIHFTGDTKHLPSPVSVTVSWNRGGLNRFWWDNTTSDTGSHTFSVPRAGGTIGQGGDVLSAVFPLPWVLNSTSVQQTGTVTFTASGVQPLTLSVVMPPHFQP